MQRGFSILVVTIVLMLLALYATVGGMLIAPEADEVGSISQAERSLFIAEGGLNMTHFLLKDNWTSWNDPTKFPDQSVGGGTYHIDITDDDDGDNNLNGDSNGKLVVTARGTVGNANRYVRALVDRTGPALMSGVYSGGDVGGENQVTGDVVENGDEIPGLDTAAAITAAQANHQNGYAARADGNYFLGDFPGGNQKPTSLNGVLYVDRFANGNLADVHLSSGLSTTSSSPAFLIIIGNLHISGSVHFNGLIYIAGGGMVDVDVGGSVDIDGGIITTGDVSFSGSSSLSYVSGNVITDTTTGLMTGIGGPHTTSWQEYFP